jgi:hypothetical protein
LGQPFTGAIEYHNPLPPGFALLQKICKKCQRVRACTNDSNVARAFYQGFLPRSK